LLKLGRRLPSWTLQAQPGPATGPFHWDSRRLSVEEMARLQTFPKRLKYSGSVLSQRRQVGNAVPSLLAEVLAREIRAQLLDEPIGGPLALRVRPRRPIRRGRRMEPVPKRYWSHVGQHPDHP